MSRRSPHASRLPHAYASLGGALMLFACWNGCDIDRSGLSAVAEQPGGSGGQISPSLGTGGRFGSDTGGGSIHFGTGGVGGRTGGPGGGNDAPDSGGSAGAGRPGANGGGGGPRPGGRGGSTTPTGGRGGWWSGGAGRTGSTGGSDGGLPLCDPSIRDEDSCDFGTPDCRKACGAAALATKTCSCTNHQWACDDCVNAQGN